MSRPALSAFERRGVPVNYGDSGPIRCAAETRLLLGGMSPSRRNSAATASAISSTVRRTSRGFVLSVVPAQSSLPSLTA